MCSRRIVSIGEVGPVTTGRTPPSSRPECFGDVMPFITPTDMTGTRTAARPQRHLSDEGVNLLRKCVVQDGVAVSCIGWQMGKALLIREACVTNQQINTVVPDRDDVELLYLYYNLSSRRDEIFRMGAGGSRTPILNKSAFSRLKVELPSLQEQRRIAHILGTLDDKIELNRRMNWTLEAIARAVFKSWFIDFDPVIDNAILSGKPIPDEFAERAEVRREILARSQPSPPTPLPEVEGRNYRGGFGFAGLVEKARELRRKETPAEEILWELLRDRRFLDSKFRRQHQIGDYIADFYCHELKLVIELDGGIHQTQEAKDAKRDAYMQSLGLTVLRIPNAEVLDAPDHVLSDIGEAVVVRPSPTGRGGGEGVAGYRHLFPSSFQDSPLGKIPTGWEVVNLSDIAEVNSRSIGKDYSISEIEYVDISSVNEGILSEPMRLQLETAPSRARRLVHDGDTIWSCVRPNRKAYLYIHQPSVDLVVSTGFAVLSPTSVPPSFLYHWTTTQAFVDYLTSLAQGAAYPAVRASTFEEAAVLLPSSKVLSAFDDLAAPLRSLISEHEGTSRALGRIRDTLLPRLLSGGTRLISIEDGEANE